MLVVRDQLLLRAWRLHGEQAGEGERECGCAHRGSVDCGGWQTLWAEWVGLDWEVGAPLKVVPVAFPVLGVGVAWNHMAIWSLPLTVLVTTGLWKSLFPPYKKCLWFHSSLTHPY